MDFASCEIASQVLGAFNLKKKVTFASLNAFPWPRRNGWSPRVVEHRPFGGRSRYWMHSSLFPMRTAGVEASKNFKQRMTSNLSYIGVRELQNPLAILQNIKDYGALSYSCRM